MSNEPINIQNLLQLYILQNPSAKNQKRIPYIESKNMQQNPAKEEHLKINLVHSQIL